MVYNENKFLKEWLDLSPNEKEKFIKQYYKEKETIKCGNCGLIIEKNQETITIKNYSGKETSIHIKCKYKSLKDKIFCLKKDVETCKRCVVDYTNKIPIYENNISLIEKEIQELAKKYPTEIVMEIL